MANLAAEPDAEKPLWQRLALCDGSQLGERTLLRDARPARETRRRRAGLADDGEARRAPVELPGDLFGGSRDPPRSAEGPTQSTTAPPSRTSGRHHSAAVGGWASAFATATPAQSVSCSSARPQTTRAFAGANVSRNSHLRRSASSSTTSRSGERVRERDARARRRRCRRPRSRPSKRATRSAPRGSRRAARGVLRRDREAPSAPELRRPPRASPQAGRTTTYRFGSVPSLAVCTPGTSLRRSCTTFRSTGVIGSSSTRSPRTARSALRSAIPSSVATSPVPVAGRVDRHRLVRAASGRRRRSRLPAVHRSSGRACRSAVRARRRCSRRRSRLRSLSPRRVRRSPWRRRLARQARAHAFRRRSRRREAAGAAGGRPAATVATTRAGAYPTPSSPRSPSETT